MTSEVTEKVMKTVTEKETEQVTDASLVELLANRPDSIDALTRRVTPQIHAALQSAIELRKWDDGTALSVEQLEHCLQLVILYEESHLPEQQRTGFSIPNSCKAKQQGADEAQTISIRGNDRA